jgi:outer membrane protein assembly factor BamB
MIPPLPDGRPTTPRRGVTLRLAVMGVLAAWVLFGVRPAVQAQRPVAGKAGKPPLPDGGADSSVDAATAPDASRARRYVSQTLHFRERQQKQILDRAAEELKNGRTVDGLRYVQRLLDLPEDRFAWPANVGRIGNPSHDATEPIGVRQRAADLLEGLDAAGRETYERLYGIAAGQLADQAVRDGDPSQLRAAVRRFLYTTAGFDAGHRLALLAFDRGDFDRAAEIWEGLFRIPLHRSRITPAMRLQLAVACRKTGRAEEADRISRQLGGRLFRIGGRQMTADRYLRGEVPAVVISDWRLPLGNARRNRDATVSVPYPQPLWTFEYAPTGKSPTFPKLPASGPKLAASATAAAANWRQEQRSRGRSTAVVNSPLVVRNAVLLRDFNSVKSLDLRSGRVNWTYPSSVNLAESLKGGGRPVGDNNPFGAVAVETQPEFGRDYAANSLLHSLTSDGRRVYFVDDTSLSFPARDPRLRFGRRRRRFRRLQPVEPVQTWNRLVAVDLASRSPAGGRGWSETNPRRLPTPGLPSGPAPATRRRALWKLGGPDNVAALDGAAATQTSADKASGPLAGHFFLGPPLPAMGRLYVVSEFKQQMRLLCLRPESGRLVWSQPLAMMDRNVALDRFRYTRSCTPAFADGLLICPTRTGFLTAVDALTGTLKWAAMCGDDPQELQFAEFAYFDRVARGHGGFRSLPMIHNGRVFFLPAQSNQLFCFDLQTGRTLWKRPRDNAEYLAAADAETVVVVGRRYAQGLSPTNGAIRWQTYTGMPSGRGLATRSQYLLPVETGRVLSLDLRTGRLGGFGLPGLTSTANPETAGIPGAVDTWQPGNLVAAGDGILSAEPDRMRLFPTARRRLDVVERSLKAGRPSVAALHRAAELAALAGEFDKADRWLRFALRRLDADGPNVAVRSANGRPFAERKATMRLAVRKLLRELLFTRLEFGTDDPSKLLPRLERLAVSPDDRGRYLIRKAEFDLLRRNGADLLRTVEELCGLDAKRLLTTPGRESHLVSAAAWAPAILERARQTGDGGLISIIGRAESQRRQTALESKGLAPLEHYLRTFGTWPRAGAVRNELARRLMHRGEDQRAELLLLGNRSHPETAAAATELLFQLWTAHGLHDRAAELLTDKATRTLAASRSRTTMTAFALRRLAGPRSVRRVTIRETVWDAGDLTAANAYTRSRQLFPTPAESPYDLLDLGDGVQTELAVIHRATGVSAGKIAIESRNSFPASARYAHVGQFLSLGSAGKLHGLSLLELYHGKPFWTARPQGFENRQDILLVGPAGATFAVFQARGTLLAADPGTGRLLWQRNDLPESAGLRSDPYSGLFGDEHVLTVFDADAAGYTTYRTATGDVLRRGRLNISQRFERRLFGRLLAYVAEERGKTRLRIWDPLTDRRLLDREIHPASQTTTSSDTELLVLSPDGELLVVDVPAGKVRQTIRFEADETRGMTYFKAFRSGGRLFVNVQRPARVVDRFISSYAGDALGRTEHVRGELYVFDVASGRRLWSRTFPQRTVLLPRTGELPFLVMISRSRGTQAALLVEAVDAATGTTLGLRDDLLPDRILHLSYDPESNAVELRGIQNRIRLQLHHRRLLGPRDDVGL